MTETTSHASTPDLSCRRIPWQILLSALAFASAVILSALTARFFGQSAARLALIVPVVCAVWFAVAEIRFFRALDELQTRIFFEALACSTLSVTLLAMLWPTLQVAGLVGRFNSAYVAAGVPLTFMVAYGFSSRRYQ